MSLVVTGLSPDGNVDAVKAALTEAGFPTASLQVIGAVDSHEPLSRGLAGADIITSDQGSSVPGLGTRSSRSFFRNESLSDRLGDLGIPDSEMDNYVEALERGRSIVAYFAHNDTIEKVEELFRASTLTNVRRF